MAIGIPKFTFDLRPLTSSLKLAERWTWKITTETNVEVNGQFFPENLGGRDFGANWKQTEGLGQNKPRLQWSGGKLKILEFDALFFLEIFTGNLQNVLDTFEYLTNRDDKLLRPPICDFQYGLNVRMKCIVEDVTNIQIGEVKRDGRVRNIRARFRLLEYVPFDFQASGISTDTTKETRIVRAKDGDSFEFLAFKEYGDALKGEALRQRASGIVDLEVNDRVFLLDPDHPDVLARVNPQAIPFKRGSDPARSLAFERRGGSVTII